MRQSLVLVLPEQLFVVAVVYTVQASFGASSPHTFKSPGLGEVIHGLLGWRRSSGRLGDLPPLPSSKAGGITSPIWPSW